MITFILIVLVATIARYLVGMVWYMPKGLFGKKWLALQGIDTESGYKPEGAKKSMLLGFIAALIHTLVLGFFVIIFGTVASTTHVYFLIPVLWVGFVAYALAQRKIYDVRGFYSWKLFWIDALYELVGMFVSTAVILALI